MSRSDTLVACKAGRRIWNLTPIFYGLLRSARGDHVKSEGRKPDPRVGKKWATIFYGWAARRSQPAHSLAARCSKSEVQARNDGSRIESRALTPPLSQREREELAFCRPRS